MLRITKIQFTALLMAIACSASAQSNAVLSLDSCRVMALANNKQLLMSRERITGAEYKKKEAFAAYLPSLDFAGGYSYNQKEISIFDSDQKLPTLTFDPMSQSYQYNIAKNPLTGQPLTTADGTPIPETVALIPKEAMEYDIHNLFFGAVTLTQPIYMGGKIKALNDMAKYNKQLNEALYDKEAQNVAYSVDAAYWQVVSLKAKFKLAKSYVDLLDSLDHNVELMLEQGVATRSNKLSVDVKLNSAKVDLTKVENGLALSRMALAQLCGLPINATFTLVDEDNDELGELPMLASQTDMNQVYENRAELKALRAGISITGAQKKVARASMLPNLALIGSYTFSNPNMFDGFKKRFDGMFSVGAMLTIPIWHWGGNYYKYKSAEREEHIMKLQLEDSKELIDLQVNQAQFRAQESVKTYFSTKSNLESADENLRSATLGFHEGVTTSEDVMAAQTAWLKANSECIDALIDVRLCETYLQKVLGTPIY